MSIGKDIADYNKKLSKSDQEIASTLCDLIAKKLPKSEGKVWHGHPVWFIDENPIVGYSLKKSGIEVLFWSGQSFELSGLRAIGKFKAAAYAIASIDELDKKSLNTWLAEAKTVQWDYVNLPKKRKLEKLTKF